jgi:hypothetical protein
MGGCTRCIIRQRRRRRRGGAINAILCVVGGGYGSFLRRSLALSTSIDRPGLQENSSCLQRALICWG